VIGGGRGAPRSLRNFSYVPRATETHHADQFWQAWEGHSAPRDSRAVGEASGTTDPSYVPHSEKMMAR
jgi:hypothetical protein